MIRLISNSDLNLKVIGALEDNFMRGPVNPNTVRQSTTTSHTLTSSAPITDYSLKMIRKLQRAYRLPF